MRVYSGSVSLSPPWLKIILMLPPSRSVWHPPMTMKKTCTDMCSVCCVDRSTLPASSNVLYTLTEKPHNLQRSSCQMAGRSVVSHMPCTMLALPLPRIHIPNLTCHYGLSLFISESFSDAAHLYRSYSYFFTAHVFRLYLVFFFRP